MPLRKAPKIISGGILQELGNIITNPKLGRPAIRGLMSLNIADDLTKGLLRDNPKYAHIIGRSGHSRVGLHVDFDSQIGVSGLPNIDIKGNQADVPIIISSVRGAPDDCLLTELENTFHTSGSEHPFEIGRLLLANPTAALDHEQIITAKKSGHLLFSKEAEINDAGLIQVPLEDLRYLTCEANLNRYRTNIRDVLVHGKHAFEGIQEDVPGLPLNINSREFFVGGIKIALGNYLAVIEKDTNNPDVFHLAARILDGMRTTGISVPRQVELYNFGEESIPMRDLKVGVRLYPNPFGAEDTAQRLNVPRKVRNGIEFRDTARLEEEPEKILSVMRNISPFYEPGRNHALILAGGRMSKVRWQKLRSFQSRNIEECAKRLVAEEPSHYLAGDAIDENAQWLTDALHHVGGLQNEGKAFVSHAFPPVKTIDTLMNTGIAVFIAQDLDLPDTDFPLQNGDTAEDDSSSRNFNCNFTSTKYEQFRALEKRGTRFHMIYPDITSHDSDDVTPSHVREFYRGFWVKPEAREQMKKIDTIVAIYGSHVGGMDKVLGEQLDGFLGRMKKCFGKKFAITHGKGPGVMQIADDIADEKNIFRMGVGIDLEQSLMQEPNFAPPAMLDFLDGHRLRRQKVMDDIATFKVFNIGGAGTMEEAAISLCSQKLCKNIITPMIFVDPTGNEEHLCQSLQNHIKTVATKYYLIDNGSGKIEFTTEKPEPKEDEDDNKIEPVEVQLLDEYVPNYCHFVRSYEEATEIIENFKEDPMRYYREREIDLGHVVLAIENARFTSRNTGFDLPDWFNKVKILHQCKNPELDLSKE